MLCHHSRPLSAPACTAWCALFASTVRSYRGGATLKQPVCRLLLMWQLRAAPAAAGALWPGPVDYRRLVCPGSIAGIGSVVAYLAAALGVAAWRQQRYSAPTPSAYHNNARAARCMYAAMAACLLPTQYVLTKYQISLYHLLPVPTCCYSAYLSPLILHLYSTHC